MVRALARASTLVGMSAVAGVLALAACGGGGLAAAAATHDHPAAATSAPDAVATTSVDIADFAFSPALITVKTGATVAWTNKDEDAHTVAITGAPVPRPLQNGDTYVHTFNQPGTYSYICTIHPHMHGTVVVTSN